MRRVGNLDLIEVAGDPGDVTILLFHGFGADANDLVGLSGVDRRANWIFPNGPVEIPIAPGWSGKGWFPLDIEALQMALREENYDAISSAFPPLDEARQMGENLIAELNIPRSKLILGGFSQGAVLALEMALNSHERFAGLLLFSATLANEERWRKLAHLHAKTPFFQSHGREDPILPFKRAEDLERLLKEGGLEGKLHAFNGGHEIPHPILLELQRFLELV